MARGHRNARPDGPIYHIGRLQGNVPRRCIPSLTVIVGIHGCAARFNQAPVAAHWIPSGELILDMMIHDWRELAKALTDSLHLEFSPIAISFCDELSELVPSFAAPMSEAEPDGRQGRVPAGCVFWVRALDGAFSTKPEDHGNCSVGSLTHGLKTLDEVAGNDDVSSLLSSGWISAEMIPTIPTVTKTSATIIYSPLATTLVDPDVALLRINGRQLMVLSDTIPGLRIEGKPQCHIVAVAKEEGVAVVSVGCALSRARTGMQPHEMTCAIPASQLPAIVNRIQLTAKTDNIVAKYAAQDARRFA
ncbi:MAG: DUF169 domain-containing protein [Ferrimicrobium sp.]